MRLWAALADSQAEGNQAEGSLAEGSRRLRLHKFVEAVFVSTFEAARRVGVGCA